jgi:uncharacterized delta-60 repeat protein
MNRSDHCFLRLSYSRKLVSLLIVAALAASLLVTACAPVLSSGGDEAELTISASPPGSRTLIPDMSTALTQYRFVLTRSTSDPNAASYDVLDSGIIATTSYTFNPVPIGDWDIEVTGYDSSSRPVASGNTSNVTVPTGSTAVVDLYPLQTGTGTLNLSYTFPASSIDDVTLTLDDGTTQTFPAMTVDSAAGTAVYSGSHASGFYELAVEFKSAGVTLATTFEAVHIYDYQQTDHVVDLLTANLSAPPSAPGGLAATEIAPGVIEVTWDDLSIFETGFVVESSTNAFATVDGTWNAAANTERIEINGFTPNVFYYFRISAQNDFGTSAYTTGDVTTGIVPSVLSTLPTSGSSGVTLDSSVIVDFITPMDEPGTTNEVWVAAGPKEVPTTAWWNTTSQLVLTPAAGVWPRAYEDYTIVVSDRIKSATGYYATAGMTATFTTGGPVGELDAGFDGDGVLPISNVPADADPSAVDDTASGLTVGLDGTVYVVGTTFESEFYFNNMAYVYGLDPFTGVGAYGNLLVRSWLVPNVGEDIWGKAVDTDRFGDLVLAADSQLSSPTYAQATFLASSATGNPRNLFGGATTDMEQFPTATLTKAADIMYCESQQAFYALAFIDDGSNVDASVIKYNYAGADTAAVDPGFGTSGSMILSPSPTDMLYAMAYDETNSRLFAVGHTLNLGSDLWIVSIDPVNGVLDTTFNASGEVIHDQIGAAYNDAGYDIAIDGSGRILVTGTTDDGLGQKMAVWRFMPDGTLDAGFGSGGTYIDGDLSGSGESSAGFSIDIDAAGNIVIGGSVDRDTDEKSAVWRLTSAGVLDTTFNPAATLTTVAGGAVYDIGTANAIEDIVVHPSQAIFAAGTERSTPTNGFVLKIR